VSSGAVAAGRHVLNVPRDSRSVIQRQVLAAVGQSRIMNAYEQLFDWHSIPVAQALLTRRDMRDREGYLNVRNTLEGLIEQRVIPIINENDVVAVDEISGDVFGDNDSLSALVANLINADLLVILGQMDGLFTADPHSDPDAKLIPVVERLNKEIEAMGGPSWDKLGRGGMVTKIEAARLATASGVDVVIASGLRNDVLVTLMAGERAGTYFPASTSKMESRKRYLLSGLSVRGKMSVDDGAARALTVEHKSLLAAGISGVTGKFNRGDVVSIEDATERQIAFGKANYSSDDVRKIMGVRSSRIPEVLNHHYGDEIVHRNDMVIV